MAQLFQLYTTMQLMDRYHTLLLRCVVIGRSLPKLNSRNTFQFKTILYKRRAKKERVNYSDIVSQQAVTLTKPPIKL